MRILMPSIVDPAQSRGGAWTVTRGLIKAMKLARSDCDVVSIAAPSRGGAAHKARQAASILGSVAQGGLPSKMRFMRTRALRRQVSASLAEATPDIIVLNGADLLWMRPDLPPGIPLVVVAHNLEHVLYERQIASLPPGARVPAKLLYRDCVRLRRMELDGLSSATSVIFLSDEDQRIAFDILPRLSSVVIPPSFDYDPLPRRPVSGGRLEIGMFADFEWWPNRKSLAWFLERVWPSVSDRCHLNLMGHGSDRVAGAAVNTTSHGFIREARDAFARCDLMIAPIVDGGGVKVKVAESLFNGVPVVATPVAVSGIFAAATPAVTVCDDATGWIELLGGSGARDFASQAVPDEIRAAFTIQAAALRIRPLLE